MKRQVLLQLALFCSIISSLLFVSCSSDDDDGGDPDPDPVLEAALDFNIDGTSYSANFDGGSTTVVATAVGGGTFITSTGVLEDESTFAFGIFIDGQGTGTFEVSGAIDESSGDVPGMDVAVVNITTEFVLDLQAENVSVNVTSYSEQNSIVTLNATFSGTMRNNETNEVVNVNGEIQSM